MPRLDLLQQPQVDTSEHLTGITAVHERTVARTVQQIWDRFTKAVEWYGQAEYEAQGGHQVDLRIQAGYMSESEAVMRVRNACLWNCADSGSTCNRRIDHSS